MKGKNQMKAVLFVLGVILGTALAMACPDDKPKTPSAKRLLEIKRDNLADIVSMKELECFKIALPLALERFPDMDFKKFAVRYDQQKNIIGIEKEDKFLKVSWLVKTRYDEEKYYFANDTDIVEVRVNSKTCGWLSIHDR